MAARSEGHANAQESDLDGSNDLFRDDREYKVRILEPIDYQRILNPLLADMIFTPYICTAGVTRNTVFPSAN